MNKNIIVLYVGVIIAIILSLINMFSGKDNGKSQSIQFREKDGYLQYLSENNEWKNLYDLSDLKGTDGKDGTDGINGIDGKDGKDGANGLDGKNGLNGKDGINGINGVDGRDGRDGVDGTNGIDGINGTNGTNGTNGVDGREVELTVIDGVLKWRYVGETTWNDLVDLSTLINGTTPPQPTQGIVVAVNGDSNNLGCYTNGTTCPAGTLMEIKVNSSTTQEFYVLKDNGTSIDLISRENIGSASITTVGWYYEGTGIAGTNAKGPLTVLTNLNELTDSWENITMPTYDYNNSGAGYQKLTISSNKATVIDKDGNSTVVDGTSRARLLTIEEARDLGCTTTAQSCPAWLYENLGTINGSLTPYGYWTLTSYSNDKNVLNIRNTGLIANNSAADVNGRGIRPVITISK